MYTYDNMHGRMALYAMVENLFHPLLVAAPKIFDFFDVYTYDNFFDKIINFSIKNSRIRIKAKNLKFLPKNQFFTVKNYIFFGFRGGGLQLPRTPP